MRIGKHIDGISQQTMRRLLAYPWPGNVRELENVLERAVILAGEAVLVPADPYVPIVTGCLQQPAKRGPSVAGPIGHFAPKF